MGPGQTYVFYSAYIAVIVTVASMMSGILFRILWLLWKLQVQNYTTEFKLPHGNKSVSPLTAGP